MSSEKTRVPAHVGIIMDGNGRWAQAQGLPRWQGHLAGAENAEPIALHALERGVKVLSVYALSLDNLGKRPPLEVEALVQIFLSKFDYGKVLAVAENIRIRVLGDILKLPEILQKKIGEVEELSKDNSRGTFIVALAYEGQDEIRRAAKKYAKNAMQQLLKIVMEDGLPLEEVGNVMEYILNTEDIISYLDIPDLPTPDLIIRTGVENTVITRLSGFLLARAGYAEIYSTRTYWPAFTTDEFDKALVTYAERERKFGAVKAQEYERGF